MNFFKKLFKKAKENSKTASITIPNYAEGTSHTLKLEAIINDTEHNYIGNSNVVTLTVKIPSVTVSPDVSEDSDPDPSLRFQDIVSPV